MQITLTNTLTRRKAPFVPANPKRVTMYVCGSTVYNHPHIGNARPAVVFDLLFRLLRHAYGENSVAYASNYTDIDDKIIRAAAAEGVLIDAITNKYARIYRDDMSALNVLPPTFEPRATEHVDGMIELTQKLLDAGAAYAVPSGVYFSVAADAEYGKLSRRAQEDLQAGARVEGEDDKRHPSDFALWKASKPGEPSWDAPFGAGRPGWHIECSAMIAAQLGETIDIHGGGLDLVFPHHENEIAQSECAHGKPLSRVWMHNGMLNMAREKMSKSIGNIVTVRELLDRGWQGETIRYALLSAHYRAPLDWSDDLLRQAKATLDRLYGLLDELGEVRDGFKRIQERDFEDLVLRPMRTFVLNVEDINWLFSSGLLWSVPLKSLVQKGRFFAAPVLRHLCDDLNTPAALSRLFAIADAARKVEFEALPCLKRALIECGSLLGLLQQDPDVWFGRKIQGAGSATLSPPTVSATGRAQTPEYMAEIDALVAERDAARSRKDYAEADRLRDMLAERGVEVLDGAAGSTWRRKT